MFVLFAAQGDPGFGAALDEVPEIEDALRDLDEAEAIGAQGRQSPYWKKIRERLLSFSSSKDVDEALKEWAGDGRARVAHGGTCELCDHHPIVFHFPIKNRVTGTRIEVGSECIYNYLHISGFDKATLKKRLQGEVARLKKVQKGEMTEAQLNVSQEMFQEESDVRARIRAVIGGTGDFDVLDYLTTCNEAMTLANTMSLKTQAAKNAQDASRAAYSFRRFQNQVAKRSKSYDGRHLMSMIDAIMRFRDDEDKLSNLKRVKGMLSDLIQPGEPNQVISRIWDDIRDGKMSLVEKHTKAADAAAVRLSETVSKALDKTKPYPHLHFLISSGADAARKEIHATLDEVKSLIEADDFIDRMKTDRVNLAAKLSQMYTYSLRSAQSRLARIAANVVEFVDGAHWSAPRLARTIQEVFAIPPPGVHDSAGLEIVLLQAADDGIVNPEEDSYKAEETLTKLIFSRDATVLDIVKREVDEAKAAVLRTEGIKVYEKMSERWGFDVEKAFKLMSADKTFEHDFCEKLVLLVWPKGWSIRSGELGIIKKQMATVHSPVPNNMWDALKAKLIAPYVPSYGR